MDREFRELQRRAARGDKQALYKLLIRKVSLNDFELSDLAEEVKIKLATELLVAMGEQSRITSGLLSGRLVGCRDRYYPDHQNNTICPNGHHSSDITDEDTFDNEADFLLHHLIDRSNFLHGETNNNELHYYIAEDNNQPAILDSEVEFGLLRCAGCNAVWPPHGDLEAHSGWD